MWKVYGNTISWFNLSQDKKNLTNWFRPLKQKPAFATLVLQPKNDLAKINFYYENDLIKWDSETKKQNLVHVSLQMSKSSNASKPYNKM